MPRATFADAPDPASSEMLALVTRPAEDARATAEGLRQRGFEVMVEPMMRVVFTSDPAVDLDGVQGILATSANGIRALAQATARRDLAVWAVGDATARAAGGVGFAPVVSAKGDVDSLAQTVIGSADPARGRLVHVAGTEVAGDLSATLTKAGFAVDRAVLYAAQAVDGLSEALSQSLRAGAVTVGLFYSPRTARIFAERIQAAGLGWAVKSMTALALSPAVAAALAPLGLDRVVVADHPTQDALFAALDRTPFPAD